MSNVVIPGGSAYLWEPPEREEWMADAACAEVDPDLWFPEKGGHARDAKRICRDCPVKSECLEYALRTDERFGIWGGLSERERRALGRETGVGWAARVRAESEAREARVRRLHALGQTDVEIAAALDLSPETAGRVRRSLALPTNSAGGVPLRVKSPSRVPRPAGEEKKKMRSEGMAPRARAGRRPSPHGTENRWRSECRKNPGLCPGDESGKSCQTAHAEALVAARKGGVPSPPQEGGSTPQTGAEGSEVLGVAVTSAADGEPVVVELAPAGIEAAAGWSDPASDPVGDIMAAVPFGTPLAEVVQEEPPRPPDTTLQELRERLSAGVRIEGDSLAGRGHGGLLEDLRRTRVERDTALARLADANAEVDRLERELGAARATIEAVRAFEALRAGEPTSPVTVHVAYEDGRISGVRVEVAA